MPHRLGWVKTHGLRLYRLTLYGSEARGGSGDWSGGGRGVQILPELVEDIDVSEQPVVIFRTPCWESTTRVSLKKEDSNVERKADV